MTLPLAVEVAAIESSAQFGLELGAISSLLLTFGCYFAAKFIYRRYRRWWLSPIVVAPLAIILLVLQFDISLAQYFHFNQYLMTMMIPAVIAFAVPIYRERELIRQYPITLSVGVITGLILGLLSSWGLSTLTALPPELAQSILVRFVSTPFAMEASAKIGGIPELTAMLVIVTGVLGLLLCEPLFKLFKINSSLGKGVALGASAHGVGVAKASELGEVEGVIASLTMIFTGIAMVIVAPLYYLLLA